jgi:hypothetical protein
MYNAGDEVVCRNISDNLEKILMSFLQKIYYTVSDLVYKLSSFNYAKVWHRSVGLKLEFIEEENSISLFIYLED